MKAYPTRTPRRAVCWPCVQLKLPMCARRPASRDSARPRQQGRRVVRCAAASARPHLTMAKSSCVSATRRGAAAAGAPSAPLSEASTSACVAPLSSAGRPSALTCARGPPAQPRGRRVARGPAQRPAACLPCLLIPWQFPRTTGTAGRPARLDRCRCCATGRDRAVEQGALCCTRSHAAGKHRLTSLAGACWRTTGRASPRRAAPSASTAAPQTERGAARRAWATRRLIRKRSYSASSSSLSGSSFEAPTWASYAC